ncbi:erythrocyte membrane protein 1, PfEMP1, putative [Plasmodium sp. DRC-Itaito]|nr:erythrocyte membrane protein 1, PfEMP1, putative [Plasmodium sp. DRC-Itaito]
MAKSGGNTTCGTKTSGPDVKTIAGVFLEDIKTKSTTDGASGYLGQGELQGKLSEAKFGSLDGNNKVENPCNLDKSKHTNASSGNEPCSGKGQDRFQVGKQWKPQKGKVEDKYNDVLFPPRRQHMCTSNLEHLNTSAQGFTIFNYATHTLLADVLLTAKEEAQKIIEQYKEKNKENGKEILDDQKHKDCICRAMKNSFADLGDIIRGRDLWKNNSGMKQLEEKLKNVFEKIKQKATKGAYYKNDDSPFTKLRDAWWSQNRDQVWGAMLCATKTSGITCDGRGSSGPGSTGNRNPPPKSRPRPAPAPRPPRPPRPNHSVAGRSSSVDIPYHDYVPQRLRWLTEWSEWYCKTQYKHYMDLVEACNECKTNQSCTQCKDCLEKCKAYQTFIQQWSGDWDTQKQQYQTYYNEAKTKGGNGGGSDENEKYLYKFLYELHEKNSGNNVYGSAGGYIKQELKSSNGCEKQTEFCDENKPQYVFQQTPDGYSNACNCTKPIQKPTCSDNKILDAANMRHHDAETEWQQRDTSGGKGGESKLKGDIGKADFKSGQKPDNGNICGLDKSKHTNDWRDYKQGVDSTKEPSKHDGPCTGKGRDRFVIGADWKKKNGQMKDGHSDVLIPPRRLDMCTSNLEHINTSASGLQNSSVNHSFLGDVLLAAKYEGEFISHKLRDSGGICNAMKYSFADLGDIIRGKDLWNRDSGMKELEQHLTKIFQKIKDTEEIKKTGKYENSDESESPPYKTLRDDWWSANRDQIWKAITCDAPVGADLYIPSPDITTKKWKHVKCGRDTYIPPDDYIPQRLRWMTEWTENYCKQLDRNYFPVKVFCYACKRAKDKGKNSESCKMCKGMCDVYKKHVDDWKQQWKDHEQKYKELYENKNGADNDQITKETKKFLQTVKNPECTGVKDNNNYDTLATYVTNMGGNKNCNDTSQKNFKDSGSSGGKVDEDDSAFAQHPKEYKEECKPKSEDTTVASTPPPVQKASNGKDACEIVKELLQNQNGKEDVENCKKKYNSSKKGDEYPKWNCEQNQGLIDSGNQGACMPPRRQKLCLFYLKNMSTSGSETDLRTAFIKTAAAETFLAWQYYIQYGRGHNTQAKTQLENGTIPADFKRQMVYTFGDFKDLCVDKDISKKENDVKSAREKIDNVFKNGGNIEEKRKEWWEQNKEDIWKGMVCGLSYHIDNGKEDTKRKTLTENPEYKYKRDEIGSEMALDVFYIEYTPQFFRWFTEWADEFCLKYREELIKLLQKCRTCEVKDGSSSSSINGKAICKKKEDCDECQTQCEAYKQFINKWKGYYTSQKTKFDTEKGDGKYNDDTALMAQDAENARVYLHESLKFLDVHDNCMKYKSSHTSTTGGADMPQSLDEYPSDEYKDRCECENDTVASKPDSSEPGVTTKSPDSPQNSGVAVGARSQTARDSKNAGAAGAQNKPKRKKKKEKKSKTKWVKKTGGGGGTKGPNPAKVTTYEKTTPDGGKAKIEITMPAPEPDPDSPGTTEDDEDDEDEDEDDDEEDKDGNTSGSTTTVVEPDAAGVSNQVDQSSAGAANQGNAVSNAVSDPATATSTPVTSSTYSSTSPLDPANLQNGANSGSPGNPGATSSGLPPAPTTDPFAELNTCPFQNGSTTNQSYCSKYGNAGCRKKALNKELDKWTNSLVKVSTSTTSTGILVPPRRRQLCFPRTRISLSTINDRDTFKKRLLHDAYNEAKQLWGIYGRNPEKALEAMKYSFADYGNLVKGDDMVNDLDNLQTQLNKIFKNDKDGNQSEKVTDNRKEWWNENKKHVWNVMLCQYTGKDKKDHCNEYDKIDQIPQFLRWLEEWAQHFCTWKKQLETKVKSECDNVNCDNGTSSGSGTGKIATNCTRACTKYKHFIFTKDQEYKSLKKKYEEFKSTNGNGEDAHEYLKGKCKEVKCDCLSDKLKTDNNWKQPYDTFDDKDLKGKCECQIKPSTSNSSISTAPSSVGGFRGLLDHLKNTLFNLTEPSAKLGVAVTNEAIKKAPDIIPEAVNLGFKSGSGALGVISSILYNGKSGAGQTDPNSVHSAGSSGTGSTGNQNPQTSGVHSASGGSHVVSQNGPSVAGGAAGQPQAPPQVPTSTASSPGSGSPLSGSQPSGTTPTSDIFTSTISPVGISIALGSIALLYYLKIPQKNHNIPTYKSTNRYVPYTKYRGKTYIYVEENDDDDTYIGNISSSDVTTSDSEVDEIDINEIYGYSGGKHRTLIDIVLRPSASGSTDIVDTKHSDTTPSDNHSASVTHSTSDTTPPSGTNPSDTIYSDTTTYSDNTTHSDTTIPGNTTTHSDTSYSGDIYGANFIIQIQDRQLGGNNTYIYDVGGISSGTTTSSGNTTSSGTTQYSGNIHGGDIHSDDTINRGNHYTSDTHMYSGTDLIHDSLSGSGIDIYEELLKRKEKELCGDQI